MDCSSFFPLSVNDPYIVSTLPGGLLVFEGELYFRSLKSHPFSLPIHRHLLVAHSTRFFQPSLLSSFWSPLTPSSFPFVLSSPADSPFPPLLNHHVPTVLCSFAVVHHTLITSKNQMWRPPVLLLLKSPHNRAQGYLKLSVKTASRSFTPPQRIVMDVLSDCSIWLPYLKRGSISHCTFWARGEQCFCVYGQKVFRRSKREKMEEGVDEVLA